MKLNKIRKQAGLTLIEVTLVIAVLLGLISVLFVGISAYKEGSDRAKCILNIVNCQKAVRSHQNMYEGTIGGTLLIATITGPGNMLETAPVCPNGGAYTSEITYPVVGTAYLTCDRAGHVPASTSGW
jgi:type II secretory pathway pseudopilin PulG